LLGNTLQSDTLPAFAEIAIVGGGLHGGSVAYWFGWHVWAHARCRSNAAHWRRE